MSSSSPSQPPLVDIAAVEAALRTIVGKSDYNPSSPVKHIRKKLEKMLKVPKKSLKGSDNEIAAVLKIIADESTAANIIATATATTTGTEAAATAATASTSTAPNAPKIAGSKKRRSSAPSEGTPSRSVAIDANEELLNTYNVRRKVLQLLHVSSLDELTVRKILIHLEKVFNVPGSALTEFKKDIKSVIDDYKTSHVLTGQTKTVRFSKAEDEIIMRAVNQYKETYDLSDADLCPMLREEGVKQKRHFKVWNEISDLLPHRKPITINMRAQRLMREKNGEWTPEQVQEIRMLSEQGLSWSAIAKMLGKLREDCRGLMVRNEKRINQGRFSKDEDSRLYDALKVVHPFESDLNLPLDGVKWVEVAKLMNNERLPTDYCRRWRLTRVRQLRAAMGIKPVTLQKGAIRHSLEEEVLDYVAQSGAEDATEITWASIDKLKEWTLGTASRVWNVMMKRLPTGTCFADAVDLLLEKRESGDGEDISDQEEVNENGKRPAEASARMNDTAEESNAAQSKKKVKARPTPVKEKEQTPQQEEQGELLEDPLKATPKKGSKKARVEPVPNSVYLV